MQTVKELPACPVETTLMLIGDKWKARYKAFRGAEKIYRQRVAEGIDRAAPGYGGKRTDNPEGICRSAAKGRVQSY